MYEYSDAGIVVYKTPGINCESQVAWGVNQIFWIQLSEELTGPEGYFKH